MVEVRTFSTGRDRPTGGDPPGGGESKWTLVDSIEGKYEIMSDKLQRT